MFLIVDANATIIRMGSTSNVGDLPTGWREVELNDDQAAIFDEPGVKTLGADGTISVAPPGPDVLAQQQAQMAQQRLGDALTMLNSAAVMADQPTRDAFARQIGIQPLTIPITQKATTADIKPLAGP